MLQGKAIRGQTPPPSGRDHALVLGDPGAVVIRRSPAGWPKTGHGQENVSTGPPCGRGAPFGRQRPSRLSRGAEMRRGAAVSKS